MEHSTGSIITIYTMHAYTIGSCFFYRLGSEEYFVQVIGWDCKYPSTYRLRVKVISYDDGPQLRAKIKCVVPTLKIVESDFMVLEDE